jgi:hypothetical protein
MICGPGTQNDGHPLAQVVICDDQTVSARFSFGLSIFLWKTFYLLISQFR